jgi:hypothetical protein
MMKGFERIVQRICSGKTLFCAGVEVEPVAEGPIQ